MPGRCTSSGSIAPTRQDVLLDLDDRDPRRHRHQRVEIALRAAEAEIAGFVGLRCPDKGVVERQCLFQQVFAAVEHARLAALGEFGADRGRRVEGRDAGAGGAHALGQGALRHQLGLDQPLFVIFGQREFLRGAGRRGERADDLRDLVVADQPFHRRRVRRHRRAAARPVRDAGQPLRALFGERLVKIDRHADDGEAAEPDHRPVRNVAHGIGEAGENLVPGHSPTPPFVIPAQAGIHDSTA